MYVVSRDTYKNQWDWKIKRCKRKKTQAIMNQNHTRIEILLCK